MQDLGTLGGTYSLAAGINNSGQVTGFAGTLGGETHAFLWQNGTGMQDLGTLGGGFSAAESINDKGQVLGESYTPTAPSVYEAFLWQSGTGMLDLGSLGFMGEAFAINNSGQAVGVEYQRGSTRHVFLYSAGQFVDLNTLVPANSGWDLRSATSINDMGQIAGNGSYQGQGRAFLLTPETSAPIPEPGTCVPCSFAVAALVVYVRQGHVMVAQLRPS